MCVISAVKVAHAGANRTSSIQTTDPPVLGGSALHLDQCGELHDQEARHGWDVDVLCGSQRLYAVALHEVTWKIKR